MTARLAEIRARAEAATPGPWEHEYDERDAWRVFGNPAMLTTVLTPGIPPRYSDAAFIAHAREDIPFLLAEVERLREGLREIAKVTKDYDSHTVERQVCDLAHAALTVETKP